MSFRFYTNAISQASRTIAAGIFFVGLVLVGFGFMIYLLPRFFATLAAIVFFVTGDSADGYRRNVQIHIEEPYGE